MSSFLLNTDKPLDKVIYQSTFSVAIPAFDYNDVTTAHGRGFLPLLSGQWSTTPDFSVAYNLAGGPRVGGSLIYQTGIAADATNIYVTTTNQTASPITLYFKVFGLMPSNVNVDVSPTDISGDNFVLNTDYNYTKLAMAGILTGPSSGTQTQTVVHGLGYVPQVSAWITRGTRTSPQIVTFWESAPFNTIETYATSSAFGVTFNDQLASCDVHYRIYEDRQTS